MNLIFSSSSCCSFAVVLIYSHKTLNYSLGKHHAKLNEDQSKKIFRSHFCRWTIIDWTKVLDENFVYDNLNSRCRLKNLRINWSSKNHLKLFNDECSTVNNRARSRIFPFRLYESFLVTKTMKKISNIKDLFFKESELWVWNIQPANLWIKFQSDWLIRYRFFYIYF